MPSIGFLVLSGVGARTSVDFTLFCSDNKYILVKFIEVEAETTGESDQGRFFVIFSNKSEEYDLLGLELIFHEDPVHNSTVRGDRVEVKVSGGIRVPSDLPDGVSVLVISDC